MSYTDKLFAERAFQHLPKFRQVTGSDFKLNARCPICGDSQKDIHKARFWAYPIDDGSMRVHCFNCDADMHLSRYLKDYEQDLYREYILEKRKEQSFGRTEAPKVDISDKFKAKMPVIEKLNFCERLDRLDKAHPIIKYVRSRCIPEERWNRLWFTMQWPALVNSVNPGTYKNETNEPRLVIPIFNKDKEIESFQGRALRSDAPQKYITIKAHDKATKIYGLDTVDERQRVWVMEGPIDTLFIPNAIAITGGSLDLGTVPFKETRVWVMDSEQRHPDTIKRMARLIEAGEKVVFWDKVQWPSKDINDMVKDDGATPEQILDYMNKNIEQGLMGKMRLSRYARVSHAKS